MSYEELGARIRRLRIERKLSQDRLAIEARVDQSGLSKFERGKDRGMGEPSLRRIASVLEISFDQMISQTNYETMGTSELRNA